MLDTEAEEAVDGDAAGVGAVAGDHGVGVFGEGSFVVVAIFGGEG